LPPIEALLQTKMELGRSDDLVVGPSNARSVFTTTLADAPSPMALSAVGVAAIDEALVQERPRLLAPTTKSGLPRRSRANQKPGYAR